MQLDVLLRKQGISNVPQPVECNQVSADSEIMVLLNQAVKKVFMLGFSDQTKLNGLEFFNCGDNRCQVDVGFLSLFPFGLPTASERFLSGRKGDVPLPVKLKHESPANPILEYAVRLSPIPLAANSQGQRPTALIRVIGDKLTEKVDVVGAYGTFAVSEHLGHVGNIADSALERTPFIKKMVIG